MFIDSAKALQEACKRLATSDALALDTEFIREDTYYPRPCLLQIAHEHEAYAIDLIALDESALLPLKNLLLDTRRTKVLHAAHQDIEVFQLLFGEVPLPLFDTQIAEAFLSPQIQIGLAPLIEKYGGPSLPKTSSLTDWTRRPLSAAQLSYALDDVKYLLPLYKTLKERLIEKGRYAWFLPENQKEVEKAATTEDLADAYRHVKRIHTLRPRAFSVACALASWRESEARKTNRPRRRIMADEVLISLAKHRHLDAQAMHLMRGTMHLSEAQKRELLDVVDKASAHTSSQDFPKACKPKDPKGEIAVADLLFSYVRALSEKEQIAPSLIASKEDIVDFIRADSASRLSSGWRWELAGKQIKRILAGEVGLYVKDAHLEIK